MGRRCLPGAAAREKYLKAYLILVGEDPPRIHDLPRLLALCMKSDPTLAATTDQCVFLSRIGAISRYPDNPAEPTEEDARKAVHLAREVREAMRARLPRGSE